MDQTDLLIVGAGPTGLVAAVSLRLAGVTVRILEKAECGFTSSRALGCQARAMEALEALGVVDDVLAVSERVESSILYNERGEIGRQKWVPPDAPYPYTYVFAQSGLEEILRRRLSTLGVEVTWGTEVQSVSQSDNGVTAVDQHGVVYQAGWIIGADGGRSVVRTSSGIPFEGDATGETYYLADLDLKSPPSMSNALSWMGTTGVLMMMRMPGDPHRWRLFADVTEAASEGTLPEPSRDLAQSLIDTRGPGPGSIQVERSVWESHFRIQMRQATSYRLGRVFLAGDAAHVFPPFGGQGMNTGILDAYNLAWKLAIAVQLNGTDALLDTYHQERYPIDRKVIQDVEQRRKGFAIRGTVARYLRDTVFRVILASTMIQQFFSLTISQLAQSYCGESWLALQTDHSKRVRAGDRAPDALLGSERLFTLFSPTKSTLLVLGDHAPTIGSLPAGVQIVEITNRNDPSSTIRDRYAAKNGALVLVRPDGHIGFRGKLSDVVQLRAYVARVYGPWEGK